jgi:hypothetical protein
MSDDKSLGSGREQTVSTKYQDERVKRFLAHAIPPRAPVPSTAAEKRHIRTAPKTAAAKRED